MNSIQMIKTGVLGKGLMPTAKRQSSIKELKRACHFRVSDHSDIVICDGGSTDGCTEEKMLRSLNVNTLLVKQDIGKQGAQLRMGIWWALQRGYKGIFITWLGWNSMAIKLVAQVIVIVLNYVISKLWVFKKR